MELLPDPHHDIPKVETALKLYLSLLRGFLEPPNKRDDDNNPSGGTRPSKLRHAVRFRWSQSMLGTASPEGQDDAAFEVRVNTMLYHRSHYNKTVFVHQFCMIIIYLNMNSTFCMQGANLLMDVAFWHMKHAAMIAAKADLQVEEAKVR